MLDLFSSVRARLCDLDSTTQSFAYRKALVSPREGISGGKPSYDLVDISILAAATLGLHWQKIQH